MKIELTVDFDEHTFTKEEVAHACGCLLNETEILEMIKDTRRAKIEATAQRLVHQSFMAQFTEASKIIEREIYFPACINKTLVKIHKIDEKYFMVTGTNAVEISKKHLIENWHLDL